MSIHQPIPPTKAIELVEFRNLDGADCLLADFAAAGLIKTYALKREVRPVGGPTEMVRDAQIPPEDWERIIACKKVSVALKGGTVRLEGSTLHGGTPSVRITGISFSETSLVKVLDRYCVTTPTNLAKRTPTPNLDTTLNEPFPPSKSCKSTNEDVQPIKPGALTVSVAQAMQATGLGRTTIDKLMRNGTLHRTKAGRRTLITVESIERYVGVKVRQ